MNLRKLRRERKASTSTVDGAVKALPPGQTQPDARTIDVEPLTQPASGRDEARAAFVRDTGGDAPPPPPSDAGQPSSSSPPADDAASSGETPTPEVTVDGVVAMVVGAIDMTATMFGPRFVGGDASLWAQSEKETNGLKVAAKPLATKLMAETPITPEAVFLAALAFMYVPRAFAGGMERAKQRHDEKKRRAAESTVDARPVTPPAPPAPPASPASPAVAAPSAPAPKVTPVDAPSSAAEFLRGVKGG